MTCYTPLGWWLSKVLALYTHNNHVSHYRWPLLPQSGFLPRLPVGNCFKGTYWTHTKEKTRWISFFELNCIRREGGKYRTCLKWAWTEVQREFTWKRDLWKIYMFDPPRTGLNTQKPNPGEHPVAMCLNQDLPWCKHLGLGGNGKVGKCRSFRDEDDV